MRHDVSLLSYRETGYEFQKLEDQTGTLVAGTIPIPRRSTGQRFYQMIAKSDADMAVRLRDEKFEILLIDELQAAINLELKGKEFDIVQIEGIELAHLIPVIRKVSPASKIVYDAHNAETNLQMRSYQADRSRPDRWPAAAYSWVQTRRLKKYETWACQTADWVVSVSNDDLMHLQELVPGLKATVIPNCIDVENYPQNSSDPDIRYDLLFTGKMDYRPNIDAVLWFAKNVWPLVCDKRPETTWAIVGQKPHPRLESLSKDERITITGWVPEIPPYMSGSKVYIMPFRVGSGTRLKLIEAMAAGKAIISTTMGCEGFSVRNQQELWIADKREDFAQAVLRLLEKPEIRTWLGQKARQRAAEYDWRVVIPRFENIYKKLTQNLF